MAIQRKEMLVFIIIDEIVLENSLPHMVIANGKILKTRRNYKHAGLIGLQWFQINSTQHNCVYFSQMPLLYIGTSIQRIIYDVTRIEITLVLFECVLGLLLNSSRQKEKMHRWALSLRSLIH